MKIARSSQKDLKEKENYLSTNELNEDNSIAGVSNKLKRSLQ